MPLIAASTPLLSSLSLSSTSPLTTVVGILRPSLSDGEAQGSGPPWCPTRGLPRLCCWSLPCGVAYCVALIAIAMLYCIFVCVRSSASPAGIRYGLAILALRPGGSPIPDMAGAHRVGFLVIDSQKLNGRPSMFIRAAWAGAQFVTGCDAGAGPDEYRARPRPGIYIVATCNSEELSFLGDDRLSQLPLYEFDVTDRAALH